MDKKQQDKLFELLERIADSLEKIVDLNMSSNYDQLKESSFIIGEAISSLNTNDMDNEIAVKKLEKVLNRRGIELISMPGKYSYDESFDSIACYIGTHYNEVLPLLQKIKYNMQKGTRFQYSVKDSSQAEIMHMCQLCTRLYESALLEEYRYTKSPTYLIKAKPSSKGIVQLFFSGEWYERYIVYVIDKIIKDLNESHEEKIDYYIFHNISIKLENGDQVELDTILIIENEVYWIECKSGNYQLHVAKYDDLIEKIKFETSNSYLVIADLLKEVHSSINGIYQNINICNTDIFIEKFKKSIESKYYM